MLFHTAWIHHCLPQSPVAFSWVVGGPITLWSTPFSLTPLRILGQTICLKNYGCLSETWTAPHAIPCFVSTTIRFSSISLPIVSIILRDLTKKSIKEGRLGVDVCGNQLFTIIGWFSTAYFRKELSFQSFSFSGIWAFTKGQGLSLGFRISNGQLPLAFQIFLVKV